MQTQVFRRNFRGHPEVAEGTGLGLAITQELLVERGGAIELTSTEGEGTTVRARIPAVEADSLEGARRSVRPETMMHNAVSALLESMPPELPRDAP